jgi:hypothetical protein
MKTIMCSLAILIVGLTETLQAGSPACARCGCDSCVRRVCRRICEMKEVKTYEYACRCEEFCVPHCGHHDGCCASCSAEVRARTKLYKIEVVKKTPVYKWVVEHVCDACSASAATLKPDGADSSDAPPEVAPQAQQARHHSNAQRNRPDNAVFAKAP